MIVYAENVKLIGCRVAAGQDGVTRTYGNLYQNGELYPFTANGVVNECFDELESVKLDISWGTGKNGKWVRCEVFN